MNASRHVKERAKTRTCPAASRSGIFCIQVFHDLHRSSTRPISRDSPPCRSPVRLPPPRPRRLARPVARCACMCPAISICCCRAGSAHTSDAAGNGAADVSRRTPTHTGTPTRPLGRAAVFRIAAPIDFTRFSTRSVSACARALDIVDASLRTAPTRLRATAMRARRRRRCTRRGGASVATRSAVRADRPSRSTPPAEAGLGPVDTMLGALAACSAIDVVDYLAKRRTPAARLDVRVDAERRPTAPRRLCCARGSSSRSTARESTRARRARDRALVPDVLLDLALARVRRPARVAARAERRPAADRGAARRGRGMSVITGSATATRPRRLDEEGLPFDDDTSAAFQRHRRPGRGRGADGHRHRRPRRSRQEHDHRPAARRHRLAAGGQARADQGSVRAHVEAVRVRVPARRAQGRAGAGDHHRRGARVLPHAEAPLPDPRRAGPRRVPEEHGHRRGARRGRAARARRRRGDPGEHAAPRVPALDARHPPDRRASSTRWISSAAAQAAFDAFARELRAFLDADRA